jgi:protein-S-isoprenylcysteine O-methyltransferase Ste14
MALIGKWIGLIFRVATGNKKTRLLLTPIVGLSYLSLIGIFILLSFIVDGLVEFPKILPFPWTLVAGIAVIAGGFFLMLYSVIYFIKAKGTPVPFNPPPILITTGPYAYARNPMLAGLFIQLFGAGILINSLSLILIFAPLFILVNIWELKKVEEPELEKRLGKDYIEYKNRVPMFFPWLKK